MKHVVMGTAGHVDHGKTTLIHTLTGIDTDRLAEEKARGMTIELGFAPMMLSEGRTLSIIDVPGHERFIKTMVAGVAGIDFALLVIAADEGVMLQTREHLQILTLLGINKGIIAVTKADLVDEEWMHLVLEDIKQFVKGTFLMEAPVVPVSSVTGQGIDHLRQQIEKMTREAEVQNADEFLRLPVDRVFTITGHGTVVTGTLFGGEIQKGGSVEIMPRGTTARVRGIQVHGHPVDYAQAGDRCALNLAGIQKEDIERGDVICAPGTLEASRILDGSLIVSEEGYNLEHGERVRIHLGAVEVMGRIRLMERDKITSGEKGFVQLRLESPVAAVRGDPFIIRSYSPVHTVGGGRIIQHRAPNRPRFSKDSISIMETEERGEPRGLVLLAFDSAPLSIKDLRRAALLPEQVLKETLGSLNQEGALVHLDSADKWFPKEQFREYEEKVIKELKKYYSRFPFRKGLEKEELRSRWFSHWEMRDFDSFLRILTRSGIVAEEGSTVFDPDPEREQRLLEEDSIRRILELYEASNVNPPSPKDVSQRLNLKEEAVQERLLFLKRLGRLRGMDAAVLFSPGVIDHTQKVLRDLFIEKGQISVGDLRDRIHSNRKYTIALLEYMDYIGFTRREGDSRLVKPD